jgi:hypothetical protein
VNIVTLRFTVDIYLLTLPFTMSRILTDDELRHYTGQTEIRDANTANTLVQLHMQRVEDTESIIRAMKLSLPITLIRYFTSFFSTDSDIADGLIFSTPFALPLTILYAWKFHPSAFGLVIAGIVITLVCFAGSFVLLCTKKNEIGRDRTLIRRQRMKSWLPEFRDWSRHLDHLQNEIERYKTLRNQLARAIRRADEIDALVGEVDKLVHSTQPTMTGIGFEMLLESAFHLLGFQEVTRTKASGDQGIDLIVFDGQSKIAIQAKLYQGTVGNAAVQQAVAGMIHYRCHRCAVITNSDFTRSAKELAFSTGCKLVSGSRLRRIVAGQERL